MLTSDRQVRAANRTVRGEPTPATITHLRDARVEACRHHASPSGSQSPQVAGQVIGPPHSVSGLSPRAEAVRQRTGKHPGSRRPRPPLPGGASKASTEQKGRSPRSDAGENRQRPNRAVGSRDSVGPRSAEPRAPESPPIELSRSRRATRSGAQDHHAVPVGAVTADPLPNELRERVGVSHGQHAMQRRVRTAGPRTVAPNRAGHPEVREPAALQANRVAAPRAQPIRVDLFSTRIAGSPRSPPERVDLPAPGGHGAGRRLTRAASESPHRTHAKVEPEPLSRSETSGHALWRESAPRRAPPGSRAARSQRRCRANAPASTSAYAYSAALRRRSDANKRNGCSTAGPNIADNRMCSAWPSSKTPPRTSPRSPAPPGEGAHVHRHVNHVGHAPSPAVDSRPSHALRAPPCRPLAQLRTSVTSTRTAAPRRPRSPATPRAARPLRAASPSGARRERRAPRPTRGTGPRKADRTCAR